LLGELLLGPRYLLRGFRLIAHPQLRRFFLLPLCINIIVFVVLIWLAASQYETLVDWLLPAAHSWWAVLTRKVLWLMFALTVGVLLFFGFTLVANVIAAPFNGLLAERVERVLGAATDHGGDSATGLWRGVWRTFANELKKLLYFLGVFMLVLGVTLIPVINLAAPLLWGLIGSWMLALEYLAYPMENHGLRFAEARRAAREQRLLTLGFGMATMVATLVPLINLAVIPASVAGATAMWHDKWAHRTIGH
jgi:CysZ protein